MDLMTYTITQFQFSGKGFYLEANHVDREPEIYNLTVRDVVKNPVASEVLDSTNQTASAADYLKGKVASLNDQMQKYFASQAPGPAPIPADWVGALEALMMKLTVDVSGKAPVIVINS